MVRYFIFHNKFFKGLNPDPNSHLDPDTHTEKILDSDPHLDPYPQTEKIQDPDPHTSNADPIHIRAIV